MLAEGETRMAAGSMLFNDVMGVFCQGYQLIGVAVAILQKIRFIPDLVCEDATLISACDLSNIILPIAISIRLAR